jgi:hypothetical protein
MVAMDQVDATSGCRGIVLETVEEVQDLLLSIAAVQNIPYLNHLEITADPIVGPVDGMGEEEGRPGDLQVTVEIPDGHDPLWLERELRLFGCGLLLRFRSGTAGCGGKEERQKHQQVMNPETSSREHGQGTAVGGG